MSGITIENLHPSEATEAQLANFKRLVRLGQEVSPIGFDDRIRQAAWLSFLFDSHGTLSGVAALKNPLGRYKNEIFQKAGIISSSREYPLELGWVFLLESVRGRGHSKLLVRNAIQLAGVSNLYATTRHDNEPMIRALNEAGFDIAGHSFESRLRPGALILMTRPPVSLRQEH